LTEASDTRDDGLEWSLFQNGSVSLYHRPDVLRGDLRRLADRGYVVHQFAAAEWEGESDFHDALGAALGLPDYAYEGRNINAFNDRLCRIEIPSRCALVFWGYERFAAREPKLAQWVLDVFQKHSRWQLFWGKRLVILLQSDDVSLRFDPIGACAVGWTRSEAGFVDKKRWSEGRTSRCT
jgi:hypothetical protein